MGVSLAVVRFSQSANDWRKTLSLLDFTSMKMAARSSEQIENKKPQCVESNFQRRAENYNTMKHMDNFITIAGYIAE